MHKREQNKNQNFIATPITSSLKSPRIYMEGKKKQTTNQPPPVIILIITIIILTSSDKKLVCYLVH